MSFSLSLQRPREGPGKTQACKGKGRHRPAKGKGACVICMRVHSIVHIRRLLKPSMRKLQP